ncbi:CapA family protein [Demequina sp. NBRC 110056]|uniref:CapA family protein n=1 Tax=Demequina sp. NBRC 110056 TaxID=1570345 RepID=UPI000A021147|nr:CapA family protein [Demequina sp. NBRC 110056]
MPSQPPVHASSHPRRWAGPLTGGILGIGLAVIGWAAIAGTGAGEDNTPADLADAPTAAGDPSPTAPSSASAPPPVEPSETPEPEPDVTFTLVAGGDILTHGPVLRSAQRAAGGSGYDFAPLMENVRPYVSGADLAICHIEVPIAPEGTQPSGYPVFGAPQELIPALDAEGWTGCSVASNHSVDRGFAGLEATLDAFDAARMGHSGTARTETEQLSTQLYSVRSEGRVVDVASISFTYGLNGLPKPEGKPWAVDTFNADDANVTPILEAAQRARDEGADVVVASVHCCVEYRTEPTDAQRSIASQIADSGLVDLYIGHHAHVPQPIELLPGGPSGKGMWTAFGHGNFLSNQDTQCCVAASNSGYITTSTITVDPEGGVDVSVEWTGVTVDRLDSHTMQVLRDIVDTGSASVSAAEAKARLARVADAVGDEAPERTSPPEQLADNGYAHLRWWQPGA